VDDNLIHTNFRDAVKSAERIQEESLKSLSRMGVDIPAQGEQALLKGLALRAVERFESIEKFQQALGSGAKPEVSSMSSPRVQFVESKVSLNSAQTVVVPTQSVQPFSAPSLVVEYEREGFRFYKDVVVDTQSGLMWARDCNIAGRSMTWDAAMEWAYRSGLGGYNDWRLPTKGELELIVTHGDMRQGVLAKLFSRHFPYKWLADCGFQSVPTITASWYWSSSSSVSDSINPWLVALWDGCVRNFNKSHDYGYVWTVRAEQ
jgi:Protein of unknown function (DUF1566)